LFESPGCLNSEGPASKLSGSQIVYVKHLGRAARGAPPL